MTFIHIWAIIISMVVSVILGFIWYGPLFGKQWMKLSGIAMPDPKPSMKVMIKPIILSLVGSLLMSCVLSTSIAFHNVFYSNYFALGYGAAYLRAFLLWLGFVVPIYFNFSGWENKPWTLFFINVGYWLVFLLISSAVIVAFV